MKVAVVGGGSTYTPELADGFARLRSALPIDELALIDPSANAWAWWARSAPACSTNRAAPVGSPGPPM